MPTHSAQATWNGNLQDGSGTFEGSTGAISGAYSFESRFEGNDDTSPEELIGAAHAGCFSMALSNILAEAGHTPEDVTTDANVTLEMVDGDPTITTIHLTTKGVVPGIDNDTFVQHAQAAKEGCPVSKALAGVTIKLDAELVG